MDIHKNNDTANVNVFYIGIFCLLLLSCFLLSACEKSRLPVPPRKAPPSEAKGTYKKYTVDSKNYSPLRSSGGYAQTGIASWYGKKFHRKPTANGELYDMYALTAAHKILPMNTKVQVTNLENGRKVVVRINDRGPFVNNRIIDLSYTAAKKLDIVGPGTARVKVVALGEEMHRIPGEFYLQVGSFSIKPNAKYLYSKLKKMGYSGSRIQKAHIEGDIFWRVQAGTFDSLSRARKARNELSDAYPNAFILAAD